MSTSVRRSSRPPTTRRTARATPPFQLFETPRRNDGGLATLLLPPSFSDSRTYALPDWAQPTLQISGPSPDITASRRTSRSTTLCDDTDPGECGSSINVTPLDSLVSILDTLLSRPSTSDASASLTSKCNRIALVGLLRSDSTAPEFLVYAAVVRVAARHPRWTADRITVQELATRAHRAHQYQSCADSRVLSIMRQLSTITDKPAVAHHVVAESVGMSASAFSRLVLSATGCSYQELKLATRLQRAVLSVAHSSDQIKKIAIENGLADKNGMPSHLDRAFTRVVGMTPTQLRTLVGWCVVTTPNQSGRLHAVQRPLVQVQPR
jgi:AraC-like DNA-binding protein